MNLMKALQFLFKLLLNDLHSTAVADNFSPWIKIKNSALLVALIESCEKTIFTVL